MSKAIRVQSVVFPDNWSKTPEQWFIWITVHSPNPDIRIHKERLSNFRTSLRAGR